MNYRKEFIPGNIDGPLKTLMNWWLVPQKAEKITPRTVKTKLKVNLKY